MKTEAFIFTGPGEVELGSVELPEPTHEDILIDTEVSGISVGTERWAYLGKRSELRFPNVPGYMGVGTIREAGHSALERGWKKGQRVYFFKSRFEGELNTASWMGSHVSQAVLNVCGKRGTGAANIHYLEHVPDGVRPEDAALAGLCGVAMRGIEMAVVPVGAQVLVCGLGVIGQYALQVCQLKGAVVTATDVVESRLDVARKLGAAHVIHGVKESLAGRSRETVPDGYDIIIDTSSVAAVVNSLFPLLKLHGKFVFQGWYPPPTALDLNAMHLRMPSAYFPCAHSAEAVETALTWTARGFLQSTPLITHTFRPQQVKELYSMIAAGSDNFLGILVDWRNAP
ncbi:MAG TPA: zinc-binding alcohol dehydrogenase [Candidatus Methylacidiphilales bacterium]|nr:zinc-binding alcohol dehydrogenase [Candidatus Methylacidiphilales bacterium]